MSSYGVGHLRDLVNGHIHFEQDTKSPFSSWTADFQTALNFATRYGMKGAQLAIFDVEMSSTSYCINHVTALEQAGLANYDLPNEYLIYGPVSGSDYLCVNLDRMEQSHGFSTSE